MKKVMFLFGFYLLLGNLHAQNNPLQLIKKVTGGNALSSEQIGEGLKEALSNGVKKGTEKLSMPDGFLGNATLKILLPPEAVKVEKTLRTFGMGKQVDQAITAMNHAAEDATKSAVDIFLNAIRSMTITDAVKILKGNQTAATEFLQSNTSTSLKASFIPIIKDALEKTGATKHWETIFTNYNKVSKEKVNVDLSAYVTDKAIAALFIQIAEEEKSIRQDPKARTSELLKKVFNSN